MKNVLALYGKLLNKNILFAGMESDRMLKALNRFRASTCDYRKGELICRAGDPLKRFGFLLRGVVQVCSSDLEGNSVIMASVTQGTTFGESIAFLQRKEPSVQIYATENASVLWLDPSVIFCENADEIGQELQRRFTSMLAERTLHMNDRIQILSKISIREKLLTFFSQEVRSCGNKTFSIPMDRNELAAYIGTNRSALSRELSNMKKEGLIDYYRNTFRMLRHETVKEE